MSSYRECPSCRALLTSGQLTAGAGVCPYCGGKLALDRDPPNGSDFDLENPYAPPRSSPGDGRGRLPIPASFGGKMVMAFRLLLGQLPLFAALVLTIWIPGHLLIDMAVAGKPNQADSLTALQLGNLVEIVFGPIYSAGIITALAARMAGEKTSYVEAMRAGLHHWGRLFGARIVAGLLVGLGIVALIVPGLVLAVRYSLIDEVVVLEGAGARAARQRSSQLTWGKGLLIFRAGVVSIALIMTFSISLEKLLDLAGLQNQVLAADARDCLISVFAVFFSCLLFLYYWEARQQEANAESEIQQEEEIDA
ncbi:MAG: hypothetical protein ABSH35_00800 [Isosphaeraceae bacterium]|jgi:hypothetical protein